MSDSRKKLALAIIDFLNTSLKDGTLQSDDAESIEIATSCIAEAFHVDANDKSAMTAALGGQNLLSIYGGANEKSNAPTSESESLKAQGNAAMQKKDYATAIDYYTKALEIAPLNTIYLSNRAAAYSGASQHEFAKNDAELATATDPKYTKAWSRLAYKAGIDAEGNGGSDAMKRGYETAKRRVEEEGGLTEESSRGAPSGGAGGMPDLSALAGMFGGGGAGGAGGQGGGMPDFASLMQNPMMQQMAQNLMKDPNMMNNLMSNPRGGMPDLSSLMNDPSIAEMAKNFMGGAGGAGGAGRGGR
ncbi:unnamed protein product [Aureobasidium pullulans]|nr:unnamed protein product [Aureobasidium pullulans]